MRTLHLALAFTVLSLASSAQMVTFTAAIEQASLASFCQEETHYVPCTLGGPSLPTGTLLKSTTLNLDQYVGVPTTFSALSRGVTCQIYDVVSAAPALADLVVCGTPAPGCPLRLRVGPSGMIGQWVLFRSTTPTFTPVNALGGTLFLAPPLLFVDAGFLTDPAPYFEAPVPTDLSLVGSEHFFQGASRAIGPVGPWTLTNSVCVEIVPPLPPCVLPGC